jgi:hypothetical protein
MFIVNLTKNYDFYVTKQFISLVYLDYSSKVQLSCMKSSVKLSRYQASLYRNDLTIFLSGWYS